jgi:hypothetical protein
VELQKKYGDKVACISLSFDYYGDGAPEEKRGPVLDFLRKQQATFDNVLSSTSDTELYTKLGADGLSIPIVFVYGRDGKLAKRFDNSQSKVEADNFTYKKDIEPKVAELLK